MKNEKCQWFVNEAEDRHADLPKTEKWFYTSKDTPIKEDILPEGWFAVDEAQCQTNERIPNSADNFMAGDINVNENVRANKKPEDVNLKKNIRDNKKSRVSVPLPFLNNYKSQRG